MILLILKLHDKCCVVVLIVLRCLRVYNCLTFWFSCRLMKENMLMRYPSLTRYNFVINNHSHISSICSSIILFSFFLLSNEKL